MRNALIEDHVLHLVLSMLTAYLWMKQHRNFIEFNSHRGIRKLIIDS